MAKSVLVPLAEGFEEIEATTIVDVLRRAELRVTTAALATRDVRGAHGITVRSDATLDELAGRRFDAIVLPGGMPGATNLRDDPRIARALHDVVEQGGTAAAICAAPIALEHAGLLEGRRATAYPSFREQLVSADLRDERVVEDGPIVTSAGPGTAIDFALALVARLVSPAAASQVRAGMLA